eukprot:5497198-Amphidinium_carterae.2
MESEAAASSRDPKPKKLLRTSRTTSEAVDRTIHEMFPRMSAKQIDGDKWKGKTFRDHAKALK